MTPPTPLARACKALRLPAGLYLDQGGLPYRDTEIRRALREQHVAAERLVLALADVLSQPVDEGSDIDDVWPISAAVAKARDLPPSLVGALAVLAILPDEGSTDPDEIGLWVEAAP